VPEATPPSSTWYRLAAVLAVAGFVFALAWWPYAATRVHDAVHGFERVSRFGGQVELERGTYTFWLDGDCMSCAGNHPDEYRAVDTLGFVPSAPVEVRSSPDNWLYNTGNREGRALYLVDVAAPVTVVVRYDLDTSDPTWDNRAPAALAFGRGEGLPVPIVRPIVGAAGGGAAGALAIAGVTFVRRRRFWNRRYPASHR
jgi:hypothetical protein